MNELELKNMWNSYQEKLNSSIMDNKKMNSEIIKLKSQNLLNSMKPITLFAIVIGVLWVISIGTMVFNLMIYQYENVSKFFLFSALGQILITIAAIVLYLYKWVKIQNIDFSEPILTTQKKLSDLSHSTLWVTKILFLQLPLWTTFYLSDTMLKNSNFYLLFLQAFIFILFSGLSIWLFFNIKIENKDKKWFKWIFGDKEWEPIEKTIELLKEEE